MKIVLSHPTGNANVKAVAKGLNDAEMLSKFHTTIATFPQNAFGLLSAIPLFSEFKRRSFETDLQKKVKLWPWFEILRLISTKAQFTNLTRHEKGILSIDSVLKRFDKHVADNLKMSNSKNVSGIYAYEDAAILSFQQAKIDNIKCLYDLPIGYWRSAQKLLIGEIERRPEWSSTLTGLADSEAKLIRKDAELQLADQIFVASTFTAETLNEFPGKLAPIKVIPYGFPPVVKDRKYTFFQNRRLKLLFVGGLSQRKGIADLFLAVDRFKNRVELTIVGQKSVANCYALNIALSNHKWIPSLAHEDILAIMREHDVLIFPSLFEGFGLVITEAMSQGTPVITTERTAGPDLIKHGENGWIINAGSTEAISNAIENILSNPKLIGENGRSAIRTAESRPWHVYGEEVASSILNDRTKT